MAATDRNYRNQRTLDIVFGVSCVLMLVSVVWMFAQDYNREFKKVQREFRDVEEALTERTMLEKMPDRAAIDKASTDVAAARENLNKVKAETASTTRGLIGDKARAEAAVQAIKADYDSKTSLLYIAIDDLDAAESSKLRESLEGPVKSLQQEVDAKEKELIEAQRKLDEVNANIATAERGEKEAQKLLADAENRQKKIADEFDRYAKTAAQKRWKIGDTIRKLPVLDAFASPVKIQQFTLDNYPIDYNFKYVTRFDRCTTCHQGVEQAAYDKDSLRKLTSAGDDLQAKLDNAHEILQERIRNGETLSFDPNDIPRTPRSVSLSDAEITEFCAHPRLDLFVHGNSPHPAVDFGCTSCHGGQGSATDFFYASHTPDDVVQMEEWTSKYGWESNHFWDFPMLPKRFTESGCLKCHRQVTDLAEEARRVDIRDGKPVPGPGTKLYKGYLLVRENGCFGCHEISGIKSGKEVGPDLRLEPLPPLEDYTAAERAKMLSDPLNPPGTMRKVGPSLYRISEKTNERWTRRWLQGPRDFRPNTKMPHFYGLSNDAPDLLAHDAPKQKDFPNAEIHSVIRYLFQESKDYLGGADKYRRANQARIDEFRQMKKNNLASEQDLKTLEQLVRGMELDKPPVPLAKRLIDSEGKDVTLPPAPTEKKAQDEQTKRGRILFTERGCLACHQHQGTSRTEGDIPTVTGEATFAPDLSRVAAKIGPENGGPDAKRHWLVQWIMDPHIHSPRSRMPVTHLRVDQAADVAAWLLSQAPEGWNEQEELPKASSENIAELARVYLLKAPGMTRTRVDNILTSTGDGKRAGLPEEEVKSLAIDADERYLAGPLSDDQLEWYIGRKAVSRLGCYGCHDIPGFNAAKPVGTPLNDWGKKDPERLAFEDIIPYVKDSYHLVEQMKDSKGHGPRAEAGKAPYEAFFLHALEHHQREGFLHQKLVEPRSYDYHRSRTWDDRLRMPQFKFARGVAKPLEGETQEQAEAREESDAREAVMTFILGLVAEPTPARYVYSPAPDKLAEVKGRQVLEKYNCAGCHELRSGVYEFKRSENMIRELDDFYNLAKDTFASDHPFLNHNAWVGQPSRPDRYTAVGVPITNPRPEQYAVALRLTEALRYTNGEKETRDIPAASTIGLPPAEMLSRSEPTGGTLVDLLVPYLAKRNPGLYQDYKSARAAVPPPLQREGEKVQPDWLFQFLRNPQPIRFLREQFGPDSLGTVLRMPRFNMSDDEATALVNYFAAVDKLGNPAEGLNYPYVAIPQKNNLFWYNETSQYVARLGKERVEERLKALQPTWELLLKEQVDEIERNLRAAEESAKTAKPEDKKAAELLRDNLKKELETRKAQAAKRDFTAFNQEWLHHQAYAADAYRLLASYNNPCLSCHQVANIPPKQAQGPSLNLSWERLRPEWTLQWIANPDRMLSYPTPMPANFLRDKVDTKGNSTLTSDFVGTPFEQAKAVRDILMDLPRVADMPVNRNAR
jgi:mono/diheme cytochrome c family protein